MDGEFGYVEGWKQLVFGTFVLSSFLRINNWALLFCALISLPLLFRFQLAAPHCTRS
jgi:hypothetical protein